VMLIEVWMVFNIWREIYWLSQTSAFLTCLIKLIEIDFLCFTLINTVKLDVIFLKLLLLKFWNIW
jgi:hypothetical protein